MGERQHVAGVGTKEEMPWITVSVAGPSAAGSASTRLVTRSEAGARWQECSRCGKYTHQVAMSNRYPPSGTGEEAAGGWGAPAADPRVEPWLALAREPQADCSSGIGRCPPREVLRSSTRRVVDHQLLPVCHEAGQAAR